MGRDCVFSGPQLCGNGAAGTDTLTEEEETATSRRYTVLLVDDDPDVRDVVVEILRQHGFEVLVAEDGYAAIRVLMEFPVDLMFTDIIMPGLSGFELAEQAKLIRPQLRILYVTGWDERPQDRRRLRYGKVLRKPIRRNELAMEIRQALAD
jgi:CheY-like chemotaxis protein